MVVVEQYSGTRSQDFRVHMSCISPAQSAEDLNYVGFKAL
jgi:hypothetical protein